MRVNADPVLPGPVSSGGHAGRPTGDDATEAGFDHHLRHAGKGSRSQKQQPADAPGQRSDWPGFVAKLADDEGLTALTLAGAVPDDADVSPDDRPQNDDGKADRDDPRQMQGQASLLIALQAIYRNPVSGAEDGNNQAAASVATQPDPDGNTSAMTQAKAGAKEADMDQPEAVTTPLSAAKGSALETSLAAQAGKPTAAMASPGSATQADDASSPSSTEVDGNGEDTSQKPTAVTHAKPENAGQSVRHSGPDKQAASSAHVTVTAEQNFPAPASHPASQTAISLASAIATDSGVRQALSPSAGLIQPASPVAVSSHMLKIELHPAELGMVTANLRLAGGQLSIELKPESQEAHRKLSSDTDSLVKSLQAMGFTVDKVTVLQPSVALSVAPRPDAATPAGRDASSFQPGNSGGNGEPSGGQQSGRNHGNDSQHDGRGIPHPRERIGGDLFI